MQECIQDLLKGERGRPWQARSGVQVRAVDELPNLWWGARGEAPWCWKLFILCYTKEGPKLRNKIAFTSSSQNEEYFCWRQRLDNSNTDTGFIFSGT